ncbi:15223_t:CDS:2, partial [Dentiscutata heterogama]
NRRYIIQTIPDYSCLTCYPVLGNIPDRFLSFWDWFALEFPAICFTSNSIVVFRRILQQTVVSEDYLEALTITFRYSSEVNFYTLITRIRQALILTDRFTLDPLTTLYQHSETTSLHSNQSEESLPDFDYNLDLLFQTPPSRPKLKMATNQQIYDFLYKQLARDTKQRNINYLEAEDSDVEEVYITKAPRPKPYSTNRKKVKEASKNSESQKELNLRNRTIINPIQNEQDITMDEIPLEKDGRKKICIDYRKLNAITERDVYPLPTINEILNSFNRASWFTSLDLASGYWQVAMKEEDKKKTAFITKFGTYEFNIMPFGLTNAPATFQRLMDKILCPYINKFVVVYLDDITIYSRTFEEHFEHVQLVFRVLREANLKLNLAKCYFFLNSIKFLEHIIGKDGIKTDERLIDKVKNFPTSTNLRQLRGFLGLASYYRRFIQGFSKIAKPLNQLLKKDELFNWTTEHRDAFNALKQYLITSPILRYPDFDQPFYVHTDASASGRRARWIMRLEPYNFTIIHRAGRKHNNADSLSRMYEANFMDIDDDDLPSEEVALQIAVSRQLARIESPLYPDSRIQRLANMLKPSLPSFAYQITKPYTRLEVLANGFKCDDGPLFNWNYIFTLGRKFRTIKGKNKYPLSWTGPNTQCWCRNKASLRELVRYCPEQLPASKNSDNEEEVFMLTTIEEEPESFSLSTKHYEDMLNTLQPTLNLELPESTEDNITPFITTEAANQYLFEDFNNFDFDEVFNDPSTINWESSTAEGSVIEEISLSSYLITQPWWLPPLETPTPLMYIENNNFSEYYLCNMVWWRVVNPTTYYY